MTAIDLGSLSRHDLEVLFTFALDAGLIEHAQAFATEMDRRDVNRITDPFLASVICGVCDGHGCWSCEHTGTVPAL
jgi:hypothetical protein